MMTLESKLLDLGMNATTAKIVASLRNYGSQVPRVAGTALIAQTDIESGPAVAGSVSLAVRQNDQILPNGTYYAIQVVNPNGDVVQVNAYQFLGADATVDLSTLAPIDPTPLEAEPLIEDLTVYVPWNGGNAVFDGQQGLVFQYLLQGNMLSAQFVNAVPGNLYTLILVQDATGGRVPVFPPNLYGAPVDIGEQANQTTTMIFVSREDGSLDNAGLGVVSRLQ